MRAYIDSILFPRVCVVCGLHTHADRMLCDYCIEYAFDRANPEMSRSCPGHFPPDYIEVQDALWKYDKKGHLQRLLMKLKYQGEKEIGLLCGRQLGRRWRYSPWYVPRIQWKIVAVPLHWWRQLQRGYNQAELIARGFSEETGIPVCESEAVIRHRHTKSQTIFSQEDRRGNIKNAFHITKPEQLRDHKIIIIDDVFTTGATTYQLATQLNSIGANGIHIYTVAVA